MSSSSTAGAITVVTFLLMVVAVIASIAAEINHVIWCLVHQNIVFLLAGIFIPFVGVIHGFGLWFHVWH